MMHNSPMLCLLNEQCAEESHEPTSVLSSQHGFKLSSLNINNFIIHTDELRILLAHKEIDISLINESKVNEPICNNEVNITGYQIILTR